MADPEIKVNVSLNPDKFKSGAKTVADELGKTKGFFASLAEKIAGTNKELDASEQQSKKAGAGVKELGEKTREAGEHAGRFKSAMKEAFTLGFAIEAVHDLVEGIKKIGEAVADFIPETSRSLLELNDAGDAMGLSLGSNAVSGIRALGDALGAEDLAGTIAGLRDEMDKLTEASDALNISHREEWFSARDAQTAEVNRLQRIALDEERDGIKREQILQRGKAAQEAYNKVWRQSRQEMQSTGKVTPQTEAALTLREQQLQQLSESFMALQDRQASRTLDRQQGAIAYAERMQEMAAKLNDPITKYGAEAVTRGIQSGFDPSIVKYYMDVLQAQTKGMNSLDIDKYVIRALDNPNLKGVNGATGYDARLEWAKVLLGKEEGLRLAPQLVLPGHEELAAEDSLTARFPKMLPNQLEDIQRMRIDAEQVSAAWGGLKQKFLLDLVELDRPIDGKKSFFGQIADMIQGKGSEIEANLLAFLGNFRTLLFGGNAEDQEKLKASFLYNFVGLLDYLKKASSDYYDALAGNPAGDRKGADLTLFNQRAANIQAMIKLFKDAAQAVGDLVKVLFPGNNPMDSAVADFLANKHGNSWILDLRQAFRDFATAVHELAGLLQNKNDPHPLVSAAGRAAGVDDANIAANHPFWNGVAWVSNAAQQPMKWAVQGALAELAWGQRFGSAIKGMWSGNPAYNDPASMLYLPPPAKIPSAADYQQQAKNPVNIYINADGPHRAEMSDQDIANLQRLSRSLPSFTGSQ